MTWGRSWTGRSHRAAGKAIAHRGRHARIDDAIGEAGVMNVQGEAQQKLDVLSTDRCSSACAFAPPWRCTPPEEHEGAIVLRTRAKGAAHCVLADPLDGFSASRRSCAAR